MGLIKPDKNQRTVIPKQYQALEKIKPCTYRRYRPEYITPEPLLNLCSEIADREQLPACLLWTPEQVADFLNKLGFSEFREVFTKNHINGKTLMLIDADKLPKMNIKNFEKIKMLTATIRKLYHTDQDKFRECVDPPTRLLRTFYLSCKTNRTEPTSYFLHPSLYCRKIKIIKDETTEDKRYYALLNHWNRIPPYKEWCPHIKIGNIRKINPMTGTTLRQNFHPQEHPYLLKEACFYFFPCGKNLILNIENNKNL